MPDTRMRSRAHQHSPPHRHRRPSSSDHHLQWPKPQEPVPADIPEPPPRLIRNLAVRAFEVIDGTRTAAQLGPWITPLVARRLERLRAMHEERRRVLGDQRRSVPEAGPAHITRPRPNVAEASVTLHTAMRAYAVPMRLEYLRRRWIATSLTVL
ncbi:Rv3235 family protein [Leucobacter sp. HNU]|uniref:Rv3235 family protein n=1 Tax=Leucobacter sp. HNU TaxID=3236805 RepID=UPI003A7FF8BD